MGNTKLNITLRKLETCLYSTGQVDKKEENKMKKKKLLGILLIISLLVLFSCSDKNTAPDNSNSGFPHVGYISNWVWPGFGINTLLIIQQGEDEKEYYVNMAIINFNESPNYCELKFDDNTVIMTDSENFSEFWDVDHYEGITGYFLYADNYDFPQLNNIFEGQTLDYYLKINDTINTGSLIIPYQPLGSFPDFNAAQNYNFEWAIQESPDLYHIFFELEEYSIRNFVYKFWQISGESREYTVPQSLYQNFVGVEEFDMGCLMEAINYDRDVTFLAFSYKREYFEQSFGDDTLSDRKSSKIKKAFIEKVD